MYRIKNLAYALVISDEVIVVVVDTFLICVMSFFVFPIKLLVLDNPLPLEPCDSPIPPIVSGVYGKIMWHKYSYPSKIKLEKKSKYASANYFGIIKIYSNICLW